MPTFAPKVELLIDGAWVEVVGTTTKDVLGRDGINITRGRTDWADRVQYSRATMSLKNPIGKYSPRHPASPFFGKLGRNTPLRVSMDGRIRFLGEVSEWPPRADPDAYVPIEAAGLLRRLSRDPENLRSAMYRTLLQLGSVPTPVAYWPCEEESGSKRLYSALPRNGPMVIAPELQLSSYSGFIASDAIPTSNNSMFYGNIAPWSGGSVIFTGMCLVHLPDSGLAADASSVMVLNTTGTTGYWRVQANINRTVRLQVATAGSVVLGTTANSSFTISTAGAILMLRLTHNAGNVDYQLRVYNVGGTAPGILSGTMFGRTFGRCNRITIGSGANLGDTAIGHIAGFNTTLPDAVLFDALKAFSGETAGRRIERLCLEEGVPLGAQVNLDESQRLGPQRPKSLVELLFEAAEADGGILYEPTVVTRVLGDFEDGTTQAWEGGGTSPPTVVASTVRAHTGSYSLEVTWPGGSSDQIIHAPQPDMYVPGLSYTLSAWVYVPTGSSGAALAVGGVGFGPPTTLANQWQFLEYTFTATATSNEAQLWAVTPSVAGGKIWVDDVQVTVNRPGLAFRTRRSLFNTDPTLALDFAAAEVLPPFEPTDDDQQTMNDVSVTREGGGTLRQEITTGSMSTQLPPDGVGRYKGGGTFNVELDDDAQQLAAWLAHLGTVDESRYPQITVSLTRKPGLAAAAAATDLGHRVTISNPPDWLPPDLIDQMCQGYSEALDSRSWRIVYNCTPNRPYQVLRLDSVPNGKVGAHDSQVSTAINSSTTTMLVKSASGMYLWTTNSVNFPIEIRVGGETMTVTNITGTTSPQTFTVTRGTNGFAASHAVDEPVVLARRATLG
jgi:hypothetical protein